MKRQLASRHTTAHKKESSQLAAERKANDASCLRQVQRAGSVSELHQIAKRNLGGHSLSALLEKMAIFVPRNADFRVALQPVMHQVFHAEFDTRDISRILNVFSKRPGKDHDRLVLLNLDCVAQLLKSYTEAVSENRLGPKPASDFMSVCNSLARLGYHHLKEESPFNYNFLMETWASYLVPVNHFSVQELATTAFAVQHLGVEKEVIQDIKGPEFSDAFDAALISGLMGAVEASSEVFGYYALARMGYVEPIGRSKKQPIPNTILKRAARYANEENWRHLDSRNQQQLLSFLRIAEQPLPFSTFNQYLAAILRQREISEPLMIECMQSYLRFYLSHAATSTVKKLFERFRSESVTVSHTQSETAAKLANRFPSATVKVEAAVISSGDILGPGYNEQVLLTSDIKLTFFDRDIYISVDVSPRGHYNAVGLNQKTRLGHKVMRAAINYTAKIKKRSKHFFVIDRQDLESGDTSDKNIISQTCLESLARDIEFWRYSSPGLKNALKI